MTIMKMITGMMIMQFKDFQVQFTSNSKTFKALFCYQWLSRSWNNRYLLKDFQGHVATLTEEILKYY